MALSANTVWEVRTTGADTNGGGFVTGSGGTDWSQQAAAQYSVTDAVTAGTTTITSATAAFGTDVVGNILYIQGGTAPVTAGWYQIISRTNSTTIVVDRSTGLTTGTGATLKIGGALLTIGAVEPLIVRGNVVWVKSGTYSISSTINWDSGDSLPAYTPVYMLGYDATRGDNPTGTGRPLIETSSALNPMVRVNIGTRIFSNFRLDGTDNALVGIAAGDGSTVRGAQISNVKVERCATTGIDANSGGNGLAVVGCEVTDMKAGATAAISGGFCVGCYVHDSPGVGFNYPNSAVGCVADTMTGDGFRFGGLNVCTQLLNNVAYACGGDGFDSPDTYTGVTAVLNNIAYGNTGYGMRTDKSEVVARNWLIDYNALGSNTAGARLNFIAGGHDVTLTADPFTDAANGDFSLNATAGGGADLVGVGFPETFPVT